MATRHPLRALFIGVSALAIFASAPADSIKWAKSYKAALSSARSSGKLVMVDFVTDWCTWCKVLDQKVYPDPKIVAASRGFSPVKVNAEKEGRALAARYGVHSYPNILFLDSKEEPVYAIAGYSPPEAFLKEMALAEKSGKEYRRYKSALSRNPNDFDSLVGMARVSAGAARVDKAEQYLHKAEHVGPKGGSDKISDVYMDIGAQFAAQKDMGGAAANFQKAASKARSTNGKFVADINLALAYAKQNELSAARAVLEDTLKLKGLASDKTQAVQEFLAQVRQAQARGH